MTFTLPQYLYKGELRTFDVVCNKLAVCYPSNSDVICEISLTIVTRYSSLYLFAIFSLYEFFALFQRLSIPRFTLLLFTPLFVSYFTFHLNFILFLTAHT